MFYKKSNLQSKILKQSINLYLRKKISKKKFLIKKKLKILT